MAKVLVRNLDKSTIERLKMLAASHGRSLQAELKAILETHAKMPGRAEARALAERIRQRTGAQPQSDDRKHLYEADGL
ncbi:MAG TPA: plasmid stabilization protein [Blastocatellia bacterium]|nr:plasmid stabilization protein [Blastocatellia bacterium]